MLLEHCCVAVFIGIKRKCWHKLFWQSTCCNYCQYAGKNYAIVFFIWGFWTGGWTRWLPEVPSKLNSALILWVYLYVCITTNSTGTGLCKRAGEVFLNTSAGCVAVLGWWNGGLVSYAEGLYCHAPAGAVASCWWDSSWHVNVPVLVIPVAVFVCGNGLWEGKSNGFSSWFVQVLSLEWWWWSPYIVCCIVAVCWQTDRTLRRNQELLEEKKTKLNNYSCRQLSKLLNPFPIQRKICVRTGSNKCLFCSGVLIISEILISIILEAYLAALLQKFIGMYWGVYIHTHFI